MTLNLLKEKCSMDGIPVYVFLIVFTILFGSNIPQLDASLR